MPSSAPDRGAPRSRRSPRGNAPTILWSRRPELADEINKAHRNGDYLPDCQLPEELRATSSLEEAVCDADVLVMGVPSHGMRSTLQALAPCLRPWVPVVSLAKGLEQGTHLRMTEVISAELPGHPTGVLTGPNLAREIMAGHAAATVVAFSDDHIAAELQRIFATELFRVYTNADVIGCEVAGALKNVMAIASGMADGLGTGDNTRAAVITRGLAEIARLGQAMGGDILTFSGLAGMGDLVATCISQQSRNRYVGEQLGRGRSMDEIVGGDADGGRGHQDVGGGRRARGAARGGDADRPGGVPGDPPRAPCGRRVPRAAAPRRRLRAARDGVGRDPT